MGSKKRSTSPGLESQLEAYSVAVKPIGAAADWRERLGSWPLYAMAAGSALALVTSAEASTIIYSGPQNVTGHVNENLCANCSQHAVASININGHALGIRIWRRFGYFYSGSSHAGAASARGGHGLSIMNTGGEVNRLVSGAVITSGRVFNGGYNAGVFESFKTGWAGNYQFRTVNGLWGQNATAFAGIKFQSAGQPHLGWVRIRLQDTNSADTVTAVDWAYNSVAGASILAGDTGSGATPEPSTRAMAVLALGAAGVLALRRRRNATKPSAAPASVDR
jgi:MYXO-CTERM domain-containing protein